MPLPHLLGTAQVITNNSAGVLCNNLYDVFGVLRYPQGSAQSRGGGSETALAMRLWFSDY